PRGVIATRPVQSPFRSTIASVRGPTSTDSAIVDGDGDDDGDAGSAVGDGEIAAVGDSVGAGPKITPCRASATPEIQRTAPMTAIPAMVAISGPRDPDARHHGGGGLETSLRVSRTSRVRASGPGSPSRRRSKAR